MFGRFSKKEYLKRCTKAYCQVKESQENALEDMAIMEATANEVASNIHAINKDLKEENRKMKEAMYASL